MKCKIFNLKHWLAIIFFILIVILGLFCVWLSYWIGENYIVFVKTDVDLPEALNIYATMVSAIGTIALGVVATYQSCIAQKTNDELKKIELTRELPFVDLLVNGRNEDLIGRLSVSLYHLSTGKWQLKLRLKNYTTYIAKSISVVSATLSIHEEANDYNLDSSEGYLPKVAILPNNWHHYTLIFEKSCSENSHNKYFASQEAISTGKKLNVVVDVIFEIENSYGVKIIEKFWYHFVAEDSQNSNEYEKYDLFNSKIAYEIKEEKPND